MTTETGNFVDDQHALDAGFLIGYLMSQGVDVAPVVDGQGDYMPELVIQVTIPQRRLPLAMRLAIQPRNAQHASVEE